MFSPQTVADSCLLIISLSQGSKQVAVGDGRYGAMSNQKSRRCVLLSSQALAEHGAGQMGCAEVVCWQVAARLGFVRLRIDTLSGSHAHPARRRLECVVSRPLACHATVRCNIFGDS